MSDATHRFEFMMQLACGVLRENCSDVVRFYDDAECDANCIADDLESAATDAIDALLKAERERALREAADKVADLYGEYSEGVPYCDRDEAVAVIEALISEDATDD